MWFNIIELNSFTLSGPHQAPREPGPPLRSEDLDAQLSFGSISELTIGSFLVEVIAE